MLYNEKVYKLADIAKRIHAENPGYLDNLKTGVSKLNNDDFLWYLLLQIFLNHEVSDDDKAPNRYRDNYNQVTFDALEKLSSVERALIVKEFCQTTQVSMQEMKANFILGCFNVINEMGGLKQVTKNLLSAEGRRGKIRFLLQFPGIGHKYSKLIVMAMQNQDYSDRISIENRKKAIANAIGLSNEQIKESQYFFLDVATAAGLNGWELDHLIDNFTNDFICAI
jgi:endonuclease III